MKKGNRGRGRGRGQMLGMAGMPYTGSAELNDLTSWNTMSHAMNLGSGSIKRISGAAQSMGQIHAQSMSTTQQRNYGMFTGGIRRMQSAASYFSPQLANMFRTFLTKVNASGGKGIGGLSLSRELQELKRNITTVASGTNGTKQQLLTNFAKTLDTAIERAVKGGFANLGSSGRDVLRQGFAFKDARSVGKSTNQIINSLNKTAALSSNPRLKADIQQTVSDLRRMGSAAKTNSEQLKVHSTAISKATWLEGRAQGADKAAIHKAVAEGTVRQEAIEKSQKARQGYLSGHIAKQRWQAISQKIGAGFGYAKELKAVFDVGNQIFQFVNNKANAFARMQMAISSERGGYGRQIRGAGINYGHMMTAIGAGRTAGMEDRQVINQMVSLQEDLAKARWGESGMITSAGRWGISTFDANGQVKEAHDLMIEFSRKLNSLGSKQEKLQFLSHIGRRPEEMEYVANYERQAKRMEYLKRNPQMMGVLERADMLDDTGMQAKIDAATKIELKRRQLLNQNAIDEGLIPGLMRSMHPENWFFNDWTARQKGVESAKSEVAMRRLTDELRRVQGAVKQNSKELKENGGKSVPLALEAKDLVGMSLTGGWAEADLKNRGDKSAVHDLRKMYAQQLGLENLDSIDKKNRVASAAVGGLGGAAVGAGIGAAAGSFIPILGTAVGAIVGAIIGGISGGAYGGMAGYNNPFFDFDDGSDKHIEALRNMKGLNNSGAMIEKYAKEHHLEGLTPEMVESDDFKDDAKARKMLQGAFTTGIALQSAALTDKELDLQRAMTFNQDKYYLANKAAAKRSGIELGRNRTVEAFARAGSGDESIGVDEETAYNYIRFGFNPHSSETKMAIAKEIGQLRTKKENKGKSYEELKKQAESNVRDRFYEGVSRDVYEKAMEYSSNPETRAKVENQYKQEWDTLGKRAGDSGMNGVAIQKIRLNKDRQGAERIIRMLQNDPDVTNREQKLAVMQDVMKQIGYGSAEEYARAKATEDLDINSTMMKDGKLPFRLLSEQQKSEKLRSAISEDTRDVSLGAKLRKFARENNVSLDEARGLLMEGGGTLSAEEEAEASKSSRAKNEKRKAEAEARKEKISKTRSELINGTSEDKLRGILGDDYSMYEEYKRLSGKKDLTEKEQAEKDKLEGAIARKITLAKRRNGRGAGFRNASALTAAEHAADKQTFGRARELMARRDRMRKNRPLAEVSDMERIHGLVKSGAMTEEQIAQNFGKDRLNQYQELVKSGKIPDLEGGRKGQKKLTKEEKRAQFEKGYKEWLDSTSLSDESKKKMLEEKMSHYDAQQKLLEERQKKQKKGSPNKTEVGGENESGFTEEGAAATMAGTSQAVEKMAEASRQAESAAASGNAATASAGASKTTQINNNINVAGSNITQNFTGDNVDRDEVKKGTIDGTQASYNMLIAAFNENNASVGM